MHISDGVLPLSVWAPAGVASCGLAAALLARIPAEKIPRVALCTSFFFVASLLHVPVGVTSVHLLLIGVVGVIMGPLAFLPVLFGLVLQALLFQHGGVTTIGVNALLMGLPAYAAWGVFRAGGCFTFKGRTF
ncbi:MAG: energy-coupling factor ABC transporter permease, partial [Planctomycetota bacterium]